MYTQTKKRPFPNQVGEGRFKIYTKLILSRAIPYRSDSLAASLSCRRFLSGFVRCLVAYPFGFPRLLELKSYILSNFHKSNFKISFSCVPVGSEICKIHNVLVFAFGAIYLHMPPDIGIHPGYEKAAVGTSQISCGHVLRFRSAFAQSFLCGFRKRSSSRHIPNCLLSADAARLIRTC